MPHCLCCKRGQPNQSVQRSLPLRDHQGGDSYFVEALLKFRIDKNSGALNLWYELQQIDAVIEQAAKDIADELQNALADTEIYFGKF